MKLRMIYLILLTFVLTACGGNGAINFNPDEAAGAAGDIAEFDLPADYSPENSAPALTATPWSHTTPVKATAIYT